MSESIERERTALFKEAVANVEFCGELVIKELEGVDRDAHLNDLRKVMLEYCDLDTNWKVEKMITKDIEKSFNDETTTKKIDEVYINLKKNKANSNPCEHEMYLNFENNIKKWKRTRLNEEDGDIITTENTQSLIDPITKRQMTDPVKNTFCGHSYERISIISMLKLKKEIRCPVVGCAYMGTFNESHLVDDKNMMRELKSLQENSV